VSEVEAEGRAVARAAARNRMARGRGGDGKCMSTVRRLIKSYAKLLENTRSDAVSNVQKCAMKRADALDEQLQRTQGQLDH
jgi:hypothetical protein